MTQEEEKIVCETERENKERDAAGETPRIYGIGALSIRATHERDENGDTATVWITYDPELAKIMNAEGEEFVIAFETAENIPALLDAIKDAEIDFSVCTFLLIYNRPEFLSSAETDAIQRFQTDLYNRFRYQAICISDNKFRKTAEEIEAERQAEEARRIEAERKRKEAADALAAKEAEEARKEEEKRRREEEYKKTREEAARRAEKERQRRAEAAAASAAIAVETPARAESETAARPTSYQEEAERINFPALKDETWEYDPRTARDNYKPISTGFKASLDPLLDGGLTPGLYVIGAAPSVGKTTLALQIANQITAAEDKDVLILSAESLKMELSDKTVSYFSYLLDATPGKDLALSAKETAAARRGDVSALSSERASLYADAKKAFHEVSGRVIVADLERLAQHRWEDQSKANSQPGEIWPIVWSCAQEKHRQPIIIIDYLQKFMTGAPGYGDLRTKIDEFVSGAYNQAKEDKTPVILISSVNRNAYFKPVEMESFKESGMIEASADVILGLQYKGVEYEEGETDKSKTYQERINGIRQKVETGEEDLVIQVKVLKNRLGAHGETELTLKPKYNIFIEGEQPEQGKTPAKAPGKAPETKRKGTRRAANESDEDEYGYFES